MMLLKKLLLGKSAETDDSMNNTTLGALQMLYIQGYVAVTGNGQLCAVVPLNKVEQMENERCKEGY